MPLAGKFTADAIAELLAAEKMPPTIEFSQEESQKIFGSGIDQQVCTAPGFSFPEIWTVANASLNDKLVCTALWVASRA